MERFIYKKSADITALSASLIDFRYKKHCHEEYAFGVTLRGIQQFHMDGSLQSSYKNGVMLFNPEQAHDGSSHDRTGIDYVMVYIRPKLFLEMIGKRDIIRFSAPVVYNHMLKQRVLNLANAILNDKDEALCSELLLELSDNLSQTELDVAHRNNDTLIEKAKERMYYSSENVLRVDEISKAFNMSKFQFIRAFKAGTGISPYQYFLNCKVERAKQLIEKEKDIYSAVSECGFVDLTHLNRHFKCIYGTTAFEYMTYLKV